MKKDPRTLIVLCLALLAVLVPGMGTTAQEAGSGTVLRIATLAPRGSPWDRVFRAWNNSLREATGERLSIQLFPGGSQGDERDYVRKMRIDQLDGAAVTSIGLGLIVRQALVLQAPGVFENYDQLDRARTALDSDFRTMFRGENVELLGWGDVGRGRIFSNGGPVARPSDLRSRRPWQASDDAMFGEFLRIVGANGVSLGIPEVLPALSTGQIDTVIASATAVSALQWHTRVTHVTRQSAAMLVGATILWRDDYTALPADVRTALDDTSARAHQTLVRTIRRDDDRYYTSLTTEHGLTEVDGAAYESEWRDVARQTREAMVGRLYDRALLDRVMAAAAGR
jgi:TRAP-type C4-dicarboxylate transport system substrate-binding protein